MEKRVKPDEISVPVIEEGGIQLKANEMATIVELINKAFAPVTDEEEDDGEMNGIDSVLKHRKNILMEQLHIIWPFEVSGLPMGDM
jgi:hypothetical protein